MKPTALTQDMTAIPEKAGILLYGWAHESRGKPRMHILSSYSEGRFGSDFKCYTMPKGAIDPGETALQGAIREMAEETGIHIRALLGDDAYRALLQGRSIENIESKVYSGVKIIKASPDVAVAHQYVSGHGARRDTHYFAIEIEGIDKLRPHLKRMHPNESEESAKIFRSTRQWAKEKNFPDFAELIDIMRTGIVPARGNSAWASREPQRILQSPVLPVLEDAWCKEQMIGCLSDIRAWRRFCKEIKGDAFKKLEGDVKTLKSYLEARGVIADSGVNLKLDSRDTPLNPYQEGAEILPLGVMLERSAAMAKRNEEFARAMWGDYVGKRRPEADDHTRMTSAQIAPVMEYFAPIAPMELVNAAIDKPTPHDKRTGTHKGNRFGERVIEAYVEPVVRSRTWHDRVIATPPSAGEERTVR